MLFLWRAVGADGARLATVGYRWRGLGASGDRVKFLVGISKGYVEARRRYWTHRSGASYGGSARTFLEGQTYGYVHSFAARKNEPY